MHKTLIGLCFVGLLAGCSGNTYGTGVSSEQQLLEDVTSMVSLGRREGKKPIDYSARPTLVKPPVVAQLPPPAEKINASSAYFPEDPENKRKRLLEELEEAEANRVRTGELSPELQAMREELEERRIIIGSRQGDAPGELFYEFEALSEVGDAAIADVGLGLPTDFAYNIISQVGNYEEIFNANLGPIGLTLAGSPNDLWTNGGLMYVPPFR